MTFMIISGILILISSCKKDNYEEIIGKCPLVISTIPEDGATGVPVKQIITATFNERMNPATINNSTFTINGSEVEGTVTYTDSTASFTPLLDLTPNYTYIGRITTKVKDLTGNALQEDYVWTFSTGDTLLPLVIFTEPENNAAEILLDDTITATFNMPMNPLTINSGTFTVKQGDTPIDGTITYSGSTAFFLPASELSSGTTYTATITSGAKNPAGIALAEDYVWTFSTGSVVSPTVIYTDPENNASGVVLNKIVAATFSMPMNPLTINETNFTINQGNTKIRGTITYSDNTAYFTQQMILNPVQLIPVQSPMMLKIHKAHLL